MSALLHMNMLPYVSWKGKTFYQITSQIKQNRNSGDNSTSTRNLFTPGPSKIYRREIVTINPDVNTCGARTSTSIDQLNMPNGYIVSDPKNNSAGLLNVIDIYNSTNKYENGTCRDENVCITDNARRRVRSSGMINRKFKSTNNNDNAYFTNSAQYLVSRNRTFKQNQYNHIRPGEPSLVNSASQGSQNVYSPNGLSHCKMTKIEKDVNDTFYYLWTDFDIDTAIIAEIEATLNDVNNKLFKVTIPPGDYDIAKLNSAFQNKMIDNTHYYINKLYGTNETLLKIVYNNLNNKVELQCYSNKMIVNNANNYSSPVEGTSIPTTDYKRPVFYFPMDNHILGFKKGFYPELNNGENTNVSELSIGILSNISHSIHPLYDIMHYKPSNSRFEVQGAVSSSDRIARVKYDAITNSALTYRNTYGSAVANALAYGVPGDVYTLKDKYGYPNKKTPLFCKTYGQVGCVDT
jgi:hypothetical protein